MQLNGTKVDQWVQVEEESGLYQFNFQNLPVAINRIQLFWIPFLDTQQINDFQSFYSFNPRGKESISLKYQFDLEGSPSVLVKFYKDYYNKDEVEDYEGQYYSLVNLSQ